MLIGFHVRRVVDQKMSIMLIGKTNPTNAFSLSDFGILEQVKDDFWRNI